MELENRMLIKGVRPTATRILVLRELLDCSNPVSLAELEGKLKTVDRSTIFRAITLFLEHHIIHGFEDGSGSMKYEVCPDSHHCHMEDMHAHFYCESCHRTFCLDDISPSVVKLPEGFVASGINFMVKGLCKACAHRKS